MSEVLPRGALALLEAPVVPAVLFFDKASSHCRLCFGPLPVPSRPHFPHCGVACQIADRHLAGERTALSALAPRVPAPSVLLAVRTLLGMRDEPRIRRRVLELVDNFDEQVSPPLAAICIRLLPWRKYHLLQVQKHPMYLAMARLVLLTVIPHDLCCWCI